MGGLLGFSRAVDRINTVIGRGVSWLILVAILVSAANAIMSPRTDGGSGGASPIGTNIATIQRIYGADPTTRTGNTVYGFNATAGRAEFDFTQNTRPIVAIYDAGGNDTIDGGAGADLLSGGAGDSLGLEIYVEGRELVQDPDGEGRWLVAALEEAAGALAAAGAEQVDAARTRLGVDRLDRADLPSLPLLDLATAAAAFAG